MQTQPITLNVDAQMAKAYLAASTEERQAIEALVRIRLREVFEPEPRTLGTLLDQISAEAKRRGLTKEKLIELTGEEYF
jgi:hypothetical protein